jgi:HAD superfamily hydrolase (TIGR01509 family)
MLVNQLVAAELSLRGWEMDAHQARLEFLGMAWPDMRPLVEARTGRLPPGWEDDLSRRINAMLEAETLAIPGAIAAVHRISARVPVAVASNSSRRELATKMERLALTHVFGERRFSFEDVPRPKPAPDIYQAAAMACGAAPRDCIVVEDSITGVRSALAAGCRVLGFSRDTPAEALRRAGALPFDRMEALPELLGL